MFNKKIVKVMGELTHKLLYIEEDVVTKQKYILHDLKELTDLIHTHRRHIEPSIDQRIRRLEILAEQQGWEWVEEPAIPSTGSWCKHIETIVPVDNCWGGVNYDTHEEGIE